MLCLPFNCIENVAIIDVGQEGLNRSCLGDAGQGDGRVKHAQRRISVAQIFERQEQRPDTLCFRLIAKLQSVLDDAQQMLQAAERAQEAAQRAHEAAEGHAATLRTVSVIAIAVIVVAVLLGFRRRRS